MHILTTPIAYLKGVGPKRAEVLQSELNIKTFEDLINYYPFRYVDKSKIYKINQINSNISYLQLVGKVTNIEEVGIKKNKRLIANLKDDTGTIELIWFKGIKWIKNNLKINENYLIFGKPSLFNGKINIIHPEVEKIEKNKINEKNIKLQPIYPSSEKLSSKGLNNKSIGKLTKELILKLKNQIQETLSDEIIKKSNLISREKALLTIHFPENSNELEKARYRLKFEELFFIQIELIQMKLVRQTKIKGHDFSIIGKNFNDFYKNNLPFSLTNAQKNVLREIRKDCNGNYQMNRLLQGDVGSGKTLVALMSILMALDNGFQACLMAPTEILAYQHFETICNLLKSMNINTSILTGSTKAKNRKELYEKLLNGETNILIGTHALIEDKVKFKNLGLVIIDEQHRFGVAQRAKMWKKNIIPPHILVMTATPIPRTLAMTLYGDLDISVIDELPPGRKEIKTFWKTDKNRLSVFEFISKEIKKDKQVYIVYPLIEESQKLDYKDLMDGYESICRAFPKSQVSILHGKMKSDAKDFEMNRFINKETQIMVATTVIEVGVNVPNASIMVIESAERFGLSQLHQLRGRVGRGADQSYCIMMSGNKISEDGKKRLETMLASNDGFEISEADLKLRGAGDLMGTQQSGALNLKISDLVKDNNILKYARHIATELLEEDPNLGKEKNKKILEFITNKKNNKIEWSRIS